MKFYILKLGCPKNDVDADYLAARLIAEGHQPVVRPEDAETVIVNTCGFIRPAKEESINEILRMNLLKKEGIIKKLFATGCLTQRYGDELYRNLPELDGAFGLGEIEAVMSAMTQTSKNPETIRTLASRLDYLSGKERFIGDDLPYAYLKISDGCNRVCSFCAIPNIRGRYRSRPPEEIIEEAAFLADNGKKELIIVSQEATLYGHDLKRGLDIVKLLEALDKIEKVQWIRLLYLYPNKVSDELIDYMASDNKTLKYFDLPLQHINDEILKKMKRHTTRRATEALLDKIRNRIPEATLRTAFIVGFPGETDKRYKELKDFIETSCFDRLGVFAFSPEEGTVAYDLKSRVSQKVTQTRLDELMSLQQEIAFGKNNLLIGQLKKVIIDRIGENGTGVGRTEADCPEIDQEVFIRGNILAPGDIITARITAVDGYDLEGKIHEG
ncbi:MAG: 30S ribosomal protein S12 methylthiotransferase RimO [Candidatus Zixiibacteriota bacterium]